MHFLVGLAALLPLASASAIAKRQYTCASGAYIIVAPPHGNKGPGLQQSLVDDVINAIPGSVSFNVPYDAYSTDYQDALASGTQLMTQEVEGYAAACPNNKIVLMGYSEGGIVLMDTLCGSLPSSYASNIAAAISYGEETFVPGLSYDAGTCTVGPSEHPRADTSACDPFASSIKSYCDSGDERCCSGTDPNGHFEYATNYDSDATNFVVSKFNA